MVVVDWGGLKRVVGLVELFDSIVKEQQQREDLYLCTPSANNAMPWFRGANAVTAWLLSSLSYDGNLVQRGGADAGWNNACFDMTLKSWRSRG